MFTNNERLIYQTYFCQILDIVQRVFFYEKCPITYTLRNGRAVRIIVLVSRTQRFLFATDVMLRLYNIGNLVDMYLD